MLIKNDMKEFIPRKPHIKHMFLRFLNARGVASHDFLVNMFFFAVSYYSPNMDVSHIEVNNRIVSLASSFIDELLEERFIGSTPIINPFLDISDNKTCYYLTFKGAWKTFAHIKEKPDHGMIEHCFVSQIQACLEDIYFIDSENYWELEEEFGPFFCFDDPANPKSQEGFDIDDFIV